MKTTKIIYWVCTFLIIAMMLFSAYSSFFSNDPKGVEMMKAIGIPMYLLKFLSVCKVLGAIAILVPGYPRLKEWAYAGLTFDLIAATFSLYKVPPPQGQWYFMLIFLALAAAAYIYYVKLVKVTTSEKK